MKTRQKAKGTLGLQRTIANLLKALFLCIIYMAYRKQLTLEVFTPAVLEVNELYSQHSGDFFPLFLQLGGSMRGFAGDLV